MLARGRCRADRLTPGFAHGGGEGRNRKCVVVRGGQQAAGGGVADHGAAELRGRPAGGSTPRKRSGIMATKMRRVQRPARIGDKAAEE